ncbi:MAG: flagellar basal body L-ring protein FlgH [bacterium]
MNGKLLITLFLITLIMPFAQTTSVQAESLFDARGVKLFDDHRARMVGDILTVIVVESTSATSKGESKFDKKIDMKGGVKIEGFLDYLVPNFFEPIEPLKNLAINPEEKYDGSGETSSDNTFATRMTATIIEVLPNGNFMIEGTRNVKVNEENQEMVLRGIVRPDDITTSNMISSTQIANAEIFYKGKGPVGRRQKPGLLSKIFSWVF